MTITEAQAAARAAGNTTGLLAALLAVQQEAPTLPKDKSNPAFKGSKYTPLDTIVEVVGPILAKHGLVWMTKPGSDAEGKPALHYVLAHAASGEREEGTMPLLLSKPDPQGQGSAITYARRYALCAVLNLVADEDDDGNAGSGGSAAKPARKPAKAAATNGGLSAPTLDKLREAAANVDSGALRAMIGEVTSGYPPTPAKLRAAVAALTEDQATALMMRLAQAKR